MLGNSAMVRNILVLGPRRGLAGAIIRDLEERGKQVYTACIGDDIEEFLDEAEIDLVILINCLADDTTAAVIEMTERKRIRYFLLASGGSGPTRKRQAQGFGGAENLSHLHQIPDLLLELAADAKR